MFNGGLFPAYPTQVFEHEHQDRVLRRDGMGGRGRPVHAQAPCEASKTSDYYPRQNMRPTFFLKQYLQLALPNQASRKCGQLPALAAPANKMTLILVIKI